MMSKPSKISNTKNNKGHHVDKGTKEYLDVMAQIAIMETTTESQTSRVNKQPLKGCPSNNTKVLLDSGSMETVFPSQKEKTNPFPTWLGMCQNLGIHKMGASK